MIIQKNLQMPSNMQGRALKWYLIIFFLLVATGIGGYFAWQKFYGKNTELEKYQISTVQKGDIENLVTATGTIQPKDYVDVGTQVSGQVKQIHVEVGSVVKSGDLLTEIDPTVYLSTVDARRASLRNQQASLADKEAQLALAQLQLTRQKNLSRADATTTETLQSAEAAAKSAEAQVDALKAQIDQTQSTLRGDDANLSYTKIYAPMSGVVVSVTAKKGQTLNANQQAPIILRVADLSTMTVQAQVSEADVGNLYQNMDVYFTTLGSRGKRWNSQLAKIEPTPVVTNNVVLFNALFNVENEQRNLLPQMTAQVFFVAATAKDTLIVPAAAVSTKNEGKGNRRKNAEGKGSDKSSTKPEDKTASAEDKTTSPHKEKKRHADESNNQPKEPPSGQDANADKLKNMTHEERREFFRNMSPEERQQFREKRVANVAQSLADKKMLDREGKQRENTPDAKKKEQIVTEIWSGTANKRRYDAKEGTVKVVTAEGKIEQRKVQVGISNRVQVQILSGLSEGERVIIGLKPEPGAARAQQDRNNSQQRGGMPNNMMGGGHGRSR